VKLPRLLLRIARVFYRSPDFCIGGRENPYIRRWWVIPRNRFFNIYLHNQLRDDDDRALHDHPWVNVSIILKGGYVEITPERPYHRKFIAPALVRRVRRAPCIILRKPTSAHRLELHRKGGNPMSSWSLFITGPKVREWGFWCEKQGGLKVRWVDWRDFTDPHDTGVTGKGCDF
jgi:hypothetical protein